MTFILHANKKGRAFNTFRSKASQTLFSQQHMQRIYILFHATQLVIQAFWEKSFTSSTFLSGTSSMTYSSKTMVDHCLFEALNLRGILNQTNDLQCTIQSNRQQCSKLKANWPLNKRGLISRTRDYFPKEQFLIHISKHKRSSFQ